MLTFARKRRRSRSPPVRKGRMDSEMEPTDQGEKLPRIDVCRLYLFFLSARHLHFPAAVYLVLASSVGLFMLSRISITTFSTAVILPLTFNWLLGICLVLLFPTGVCPALENRFLYPTLSVSESLTEERQINKKKNHKSIGNFRLSTLGASVITQDKTQFVVGVALSKRHLFIPAGMITMGRHVQRAHSVDWARETTSPLLPIRLRPATGQGRPRSPSSPFGSSPRYRRRGDHVPPLTSPPRGGASPGEGDTTPPRTRSRPRWRWGCSR